MRIVVITGLSGAGKGTALRTLEDIGYFCMDNLPFLLLPKFLELSQSSQEQVSKVAIMVDVRSRDLKEKHFSNLLKLRDQGYDVEIVFMEASDNVLERRFKATRRKHPWPADVPISEAIEHEKALFLPIRKFTDNIIDTSDMKAQDLKELIENRFGKVDQKVKDVQLSLVSFGYSHGIPANADLVLDVRFLPNPFFVDGLRDLTGNEGAVLEYVLQQKKTQDFLTRIYDLLDYLLPLYQAEGKRYLTIAIGCTGGRHRSVAIVNQLETHFKAKKVEPKVKHRDILK